MLESAATGLIAGRLAAADELGRSLPLPPATSAHGALISHISGGHISEASSGKSRSFQPMNVNFGLFPDIAAPKSQDGNACAASSGASPASNFRQPGLCKISQLG